MSRKNPGEVEDAALGGQTHTCDHRLNYTGGAALTSNERPLRYLIIQCDAGWPLTSMTDGVLLVVVRP